MDFRKMMTTGEGIEELETRPCLKNKYCTNCALVQK